MKRENFRKIPDNLLPKEIRDPEASFEAECGDLTREEMLARGNSLEGGMEGGFLKIAEEVITEKEKEEKAAQKRAEEVARKVMAEAEKKMGRGK
ncbi:MAG: hypothetical protein ACYC3G_00010 [Minisyncoccota bacterium]